jgi:uncharacterized protein
MTLSFVDTGAWIALLKGDDHMHQRARRHYERRSTEGARFLTSNYVVAETATRLRYDAGLNAALSFRVALDRAASHRRLRIAWVDASLERDGWTIMEQFADVSLSLTDAISAAMARRAKATEIFGFDADFRALGFDVQPAA